MNDDGLLTLDHVQLIDLNNTLTALTICVVVMLLALLAAAFLLWSLERMIDKARTDRAEQRRERFNGDDDDGPESKP